jgi:hypothetical protein
MPRGIAFLLIIIVLIAGIAFFLSSRANEVPTKTIEVDVNVPANAS